MGVFRVSGCPTPISNGPAITILPKPTTSLREPLSCNPPYMQRAVFFFYYFLLPPLMFCYNFSLGLLQKTFRHSFIVKSAPGSVDCHWNSDVSSLQHPNPVLSFYRINYFEIINVYFRNLGCSKRESYLFVAFVPLVSQMGSCISILLQSGCMYAGSRVLFCS